MLVYPAEGLRVRDPATRRFVPDEGLEVSETDLTWARLLRDGDVVAEAPKAAADAVEPEHEDGDPPAAPAAADLHEIMLQPEEHI